MIEINIKDFVLTGDFGPVKIGITRAIVESILGTPTEWGEMGEDAKDGYISRYGGWEFFYDPQSRLEWMQNDNFVPWGIDFENTLFRVKRWIIDPKLTFEEAKSALDREAIKYREGQMDFGDIGEPYDARPLIGFDSGVYLDFADDCCEEGIDWGKRNLIALRYYPKSPETFISWATGF